jgi:hypothetical protein
VNENVIFFLGAVAFVGVLVMGAVFITRKGPRPIDTERYRSRWLAIEQQLKQNESNSYIVCLLNADKLLDQALQDRGFKGTKTSERMKSATSKWSNPNAVWAAHKLRNRVAHEQDITISYDETRRALSAFKTALKELGAI